MKINHMTAFNNRTGRLAWIALCVLCVRTLADGTIDPNNKYAWAENAGWNNFASTHGGVTGIVAEEGGYLSGYVWGENIGWLALGDETGGPYANTGPTDWGVNMNGAGCLSGYAWSESVGWINFNPTHSQASVDFVTGHFNGYAWGENIGWISFAGLSPAYQVRLVYVPAVPSAVAATGWSSTGFTANWEAVLGAGDYRLDVATSSGFESGTFLPGYADRSVTGLSAALSGLSAPATYYYRVRAVNDSGTSSNSGAMVVSLFSGDIAITNLPLNMSSGNATLEWEYVEGLAYDVYQCDQAFHAGMEWTRLRTVLPSAMSAQTPVELADRRFFQVVPSGKTPENHGAWGMIALPLSPGFTMISPPLRDNGQFNGRLGATLAAVLEGDAVGAKDKVHLFEANVQWRTLYLDETGIWREENGEASSYELPAGTGFFVERQGEEYAELIFQGPVGNDGTQTHQITPGWNLIGLSEGKDLPLKGTLAPANPLGGAWEEVADQIVIQNPDGSWRWLMFVTNWGPAYDGNWFDFSTDQMVPANEAIEPGTAFYYLRRGEETEVEF